MGGRGVASRKSLWFYMIFDICVTINHGFRCLVVQKEVLFLKKAFLKRGPCKPTTQWV